MLRTLLKIFLFYQCFGQILARSRSINDVNYRTYAPQVVGTLTFDKLIYTDSKGINDCETVAATLSLTLTLKPTVIIIPDYKASITSGSVAELTKGYLDQNYNVILIDWTNIGTTFYLLCAQKGPHIAKKVAPCINTLHNLGMNIDKLQVVGVGLAANIGGSIGSAYASKYYSKIGRLCALSPNIQYWTGSVIKKDDFQSVLVIITNKGLFRGSSRTDLGHVTFVVNHGRKQPSCPNNACSAERSASYFAVSLYTPTMFEAYRCSKNYDAIQDSPQSLYMNKDVDTTQYIGVFCVYTSGTFPYGLSPSTRK